MGEGSSACRLRTDGAGFGGIETPRPDRGVVGAAMRPCAIPWSRPSSPWAPPWRSPSVRPWCALARRGLLRSGLGRARLGRARLRGAALVVRLGRGRLGGGSHRGGRRRRLGGSLGRGRLGAGRLAQRGAGLAGGGLGALGLAGLAGRDAGLGRLGGGGLAGRLDDAATGLHVLATERGIDLAGQARLAACGGVRVDGTDLGGAIEGAQRLEPGRPPDRSSDRPAARRRSGPSRRMSSRRCGAAGGCRGGSGPDGPS